MELPKYDKFLNILLQASSSSINQLFSEVYSDIYELISDGRFVKPKPLESTFTF